MGVDPFVEITEETATYESIPKEKQDRLLKGFNFALQDLLQEIVPSGSREPDYTKKIGSHTDELVFKRSLTAWINSVESRLNALNSEIDSVSSRVTILDARVDTLIVRIVALEHH